MAAAQLSDGRLAFGVRRSLRRIKYIDTLIYCVLIYLFSMDDFEQFDAFQRCREFVRAVAEPLNRGAFSKDPVLVTQLRKTMLSIYSNFAEGFERDGNREFTQFVSIAKGSVGETRGQLLYALDSGYLDQERFEQLNELGRNAASVWDAYLRRLNNPIRGRKFKSG